MFQASHAPAGAWWQLDEIRLETPDWLLQRGHHRLTLKNRDDWVLDAVRFEVR
jgi:hypothetical protein